MATGKLACIFDWDGTIVDSGRTHEFTWVELARSRGLPLIDNFFDTTFGRRNAEIISEILRWTSDPKTIAEMSEQKESLYRQIIARNGLPVVAGAEAFLRALNDAGILCAVGSSTPRKNLDAAFETLGFGKYFAASAASEDVACGKPAPDIFLCAAAKLGVEPRSCVVFEDVRAGIEAGVAAGMKTAALATTHTPRQWRSFGENPRTRPDIVIADFTKITVGAVKELVG